MRIVISEKSIEHLTDISFYNDNYYTLPFTVNGCDILHSKYDGAENFEGFSVGKISDGKYIPEYYLHTDDSNEEITFSSELFSAENRWT